MAVGLVCSAARATTAPMSPCCVFPFVLTQIMAPTERGKYVPAICSKRSAPGSTERYLSDEAAPDAWARAATLASNWAALRHTPFGLPVVPDVKMIRLAPSAGGRLGSVEAANGWALTPRRAARSRFWGSATISESRVAWMMCLIWASEKKSGSGTNSLPAKLKAKSARICSGPFENSSPTRDGNRRAH